jgi:hypothetical protein
MGKGAYQGVKQMEILREFILPPGEPVYMPTMENGISEDSDTDPEDDLVMRIMSIGEQAIVEFWEWRDMFHLQLNDEEFFDYWYTRHPVTESDNSGDSDYQPSDISSGGEHWSHQVLTDEEQEIIEISEDECEVIVISSDDEDSIYCTSENEIPQSPPWTVVKRRRLE